MSSDTASVREAWAQIVAQVKDRVNNRSLWEALEKSTAITLEDNTLIVGLEPRYAALAAQLGVSDHRRAIEACAVKVVGRPTAFRLIEGHTLEDWSATKLRDRVVAARRDAEAERREQPAIDTATWDGLFEQAARSFSAMTLRQLPQTKARYLSEMLYALSDNMDRLMPEEPDEASERMLARVIDRVAGNAEVPATMVAMELERLRAWQKQNAS